ncbi:pirin family protein [Cohnella faecalis]|uniref:Pirin family protein n=1 Tax=Cohnella faecalis TaxID=2315694 RepID=A0A398CNK1_9BACL|nr:pirin-like bicupin family protein [Cohnella faecalis]RIE01497.1 pirin family protein [Cohnella faecalis]
MIKIYPAESTFSADLGWLKSRPSFSFGAYQDPDNSEFGVMRVCNDDEVAPGKGFGAHPHSDMEIVSIVLSGQIRHEDNLGNVAVSEPGEVQRMSAGTGVIHTEFNPSPDEWLRLLQLWFMPVKRGLPPSYETAAYDISGTVNALLPVVSGQGFEKPGSVASLQQDLTVYLGRLETGRELSFAQAEGRRIYVYVIEGVLDVAGGTELKVLDSARIDETPELAIAAKADAFFMLIDLP